MFESGALAASYGLSAAMAAQERAQVGRPFMAVVERAMSKSSRRGHDITEAGGASQAFGRPASMTPALESLRKASP